MADKKLNAVSTASDGAYIYAEDASGNQIKISKADLATVVAGLFTFVKFKIGRTSGSANNVTSNSIYMNMDTMTDVPYSYGTLITYNVEGSQVVQMYISAVKSSNSFYIRQRTDSVWSDWSNLV